MREINKFHHHELMALCEFTIHGNATGKMRPRACNRGGSTRVYSPKAQTDFEGMVAIIASQSITQPPTDCPVSAVIIVTVARPKSMPKREHWRVLCPRKPDLDNIAKSILDACNGIVYEDDKQVCALSCHRFWGDTNRTYVRFSEMIEARDGTSGEI